MTTTEANKRIAAAIARIRAADDVWRTIFLLVVVTTRIAARWATYLCTGFGLTALFDLSAWFGLPIAFGASQTLGRAWAWWHRDAWVRMVEEAANEAEDAAKGKG